MLEDTEISRLCFVGQRCVSTWQTSPPGQAAHATKNREHFALGRDLHFLFSASPMRFAMMLMVKHSSPAKSATSSGLYL